MITKLPDILSRDQEKEAVERLYKGDTKARQLLIERNLKLVLYLAKKFSPSIDLVEEYFAVGCIGLVNAVNTYNPEKRTKLPTYISVCVENEMKMEFRRYKKHRHVTSIYEPVTYGTENEEILLVDMLKNGEDTAETALSNMLRRRITEEINNLETKEREIIKRKIFYDMSYTQIGKIYGVSQSSACNVGKRARKKLRRKLI